MYTITSTHYKIVVLIYVLHPPVRDLKIREVNNDVKDYLIKIIFTHQSHKTVIVTNESNPKFSGFFFYVLPIAYTKPL